MKYSCILAILLGLTYGISQAQALDCKRFHEGTFNSEIDGVLVGKITRKGNQQIERYGKAKLVLDVKWISDCEYELRPSGGNKVMREAMKVRPNVEVLRVRITRTEPNGYYLEAIEPGKKRDEAEDMHFVIAK